MKTTILNPINFPDGSPNTSYRNLVQLQCEHYLVQLKYLESLFADILSDDNLEITQVILQILRYESILQGALNLEDCNVNDFLEEVKEFIKSLQAQGLLNRNISFDYDSRHYFIKGK